MADTLLADIEARALALYGPYDPRWAKGGYSREGYTRACVYWLCIRVWAAINRAFFGEPPKPPAPSVREAATAAFDYLSSDWFPHPSRKGVSLRDARRLLKGALHG